MAYIHSLKPRLLASEEQLKIGCDQLHADGPWRCPASTWEGGLGAAARHLLPTEAE